MIAMIKPKSSDFSSENILTIDELNEVLKPYRGKKKIGLCVGGYDLLHPGHILHFKEAKGHCDILVVCVTSDNWVNKRKGEGRPIFSQELISRAFPFSF